MNVLQLISSEGHYGAENMLLQLGGSLRKLGCHSVVGVFENFHSPHTEVAQRVRDIGIPVELIPCRGRTDWGAVRRIRECIKAHNIDLIHTHGYKSDLYGYAAARPFDVPLVATCHNWAGKTISLRLYYQLDQFVLRRFDRVAAVSDPVAQSLQRAGIAPGKICYIENGVDTSAYGSCARQGARAVATRIGVVGRLAPEKGLNLFLKAAREVLNVRPRTEFLIVGDGPQRALLESQARELGIANEVIFAGVLDDMPNAYATLDIFVLPSLNEGLPLALLEAMAAGKPVVATRVGGVPGLVISGRTGLLVETRDVSALRDSMLRLIDDPQLRRELGEAGQRLVAERFSAEKMAGNYLRMYRELISNRAATFVSKREKKAIA